MFNRKSNVALETVALTSAAAGVNVQTAGPFASNTINAEPLRLPLLQAAMTTLVASGINQRIGLLEPAMHRSTRHLHRKPFAPAIPHGWALR